MQHFHSPTFLISRCKELWTYCSLGLQDVNTDGQMRRACRWTGLHVLAVHKTPLSHSSDSSGKMTKTETFVMCNLKTLFWNHLWHICFFTGHCRVKQSPGKPLVCGLTLQNEADYYNILNVYLGELIVYFVDCWDRQTKTILESFVLFLLKCVSSS